MKMKKMYARFGRYGMVDLVYYGRHGMVCWVWKAFCNGWGAMMGLSFAAVSLDRPTRVKW